MHQMLPGNILIFSNSTTLSPSLSLSPQVAGVPRSAGAGGQQQSGRCENSCDSRLQPHTHRLSFSFRLHVRWKIWMFHCSVISYLHCRPIGELVLKGLVFRKGGVKALVFTMYQVYHTREGYNIWKNLIG